MFIRYYLEWWHHGDSRTRSNLPLYNCYLVKHIFTQRFTWTNIKAPMPWHGKNWITWQIARLVLRVLESISVSKVNQYFRFFFFGKKKNYTVGEKKTQHLCGSLELLLTFYLFHQIVLRTTRWKNCVFLNLNSDRILIATMERHVLTQHATTW